MVKFALSSIILLVTLTGTVFNQEATTPSNVYVDNVCICVTSGSCGIAGGSTDGAGMIDARVMSSGASPSPITGANNETMAPVSSGLKPMVTSQISCAAGLELCCPPFFQCGLSYPPVANSPLPLEGRSQAEYGAFPWQASLLGLDNLYFGAGALIDHLHVITVAHKIANVALPFKVRLGDWDANNEIEPLPDVEINAASVFIHPKFNPANLHNDLAIIRLESPAPIGLYPTITNICLPTMPLKPMRCWISGWGKNDFSSSGAYQAIMKAVDVPLIDNDSCGKKMKKTRLGAAFTLDSSFICAGGESAKDACVGDGGSPLSCSVGGKWFLAGLVAWGIGCGQVDVPGVYAGIHSNLAWIQQTTASTTLNSNLRTTTASASSPKMNSGLVTTAAPAITVKPAAPAATTVAATTLQNSSPKMNSGLNTTSAPAAPAATVPTIVNATVAAATTIAAAAATTVKSGNATIIATTANSGNATIIATTVRSALNTTAKPAVTTVKSAVTTLKTNVTVKAAVTTLKPNPTVKAAITTTKKPASG